MQTSPSSNTEFRPGMPDGAAMPSVDGRYKVDAGEGSGPRIAVDHHQPPPTGFDWG